VLLVAVAVLVLAGTRKEVLLPFGPARNGQIAFVQDGDLYVRDSLEAPGRVLIATAGAEVWPYYSPDGTQLIVTIEEDGTPFDYVANADGSNLRRLLPDPIFGEGLVVWGPDSRTVAIVNEVRGVPTLFIVDTATDSARPLDIGVTPRAPAWNPRDPGSIVFQGTDPRSGHNDLYSVRTDGTGLRALDLPEKQSGFGVGYTNSGPAFSPDGGTIAYNHVKIDPDTRATHFRVDLVNPDGTNVRPLPAPADPAEQQAWPLYSPDGRWILLHHWTWKSDPRGGEGWLTVVPADGSAPPRQIGPRFPGGEDTGLLKTWSPDGTRVIVQVQNAEQVWSIDPVSGESQRLPWTSFMPDWQRRAP
jgi:Tol biopolymer transport system component